MSCSTCTKIKKLPQCVNEITIGTIADLDAEVYVFIKSMATGRIQRYEAESDGAGLVALDVSDVTFMADRLYELWITLRTGNVEDMLSITVDAEEYTCFQVEFERIYAGSTMEAYLSQTIEIEA